MVRDSIDRRLLLKTLGAGGFAGLAGCTGDGGQQTTTSGGGGSSDQTGFMQAAKSIGFGDNWRDRRTTSLDDWSIENRSKTPAKGKLTDPAAWKKSGSLKTAPWSPPEGWEDTAAAEVDSIQYLNFGSMKYDPATVATNAMFEDRTGINIDPLEIPVDQAIPKETAFLKAGRGSPQALSVVVTSSLSSFVAGEYLQNIDPLMPKDEMWEPYIQPARAMNYEGHLWSGPLYLEGSLTHTRPDLLEEHGVPKDSRKAIQRGTWSWDDLEAAMKAFEGTDKYAWAYRGASRTYTFRDFTKMFYQAGGTYVRDDGTVKVNSEAGYTALRKMIEWRDKGWVPTEVVSYGQGDLADGFLSGQFAMVPVFGDLVTRALGQFEKDSEYRPTLSPKGGNEAPKPTRRGIASPNGVSINPHADKGEKLATMLYLDACLSYPNQWWQYAVEGNQSFSKQVYKDAAEAGVVPFSEVKNKQIDLNYTEVFPNQRPIRQHISQNVQQAIAGDFSAKEALDRSQQFINTVLGQ